MVSVAIFTEGEEGVFHQIVTKLQSPYSFCFDTFGVSQVKSKVGPSDTFGVKLKFGTSPAWAYTCAHTGKTSPVFPRALCAGEIAHEKNLDFRNSCLYLCRADGNEAIASKPTHDDEVIQHTL